ncbi:hypothetical protein psyc5s11_18480 [Clostridium gelidum]|uniref:Uncharacterized protein n=1 Tax=Clostridium gelidum TaxID=704125 RepID=A0ABN6IYF9_9CLOT|nr:hypothetical protein [Clostridium gelidum]BCZ45781.1 hypothetical protein psyc5s11_18480 [Clostridium gelidum]
MFTINIAIGLNVFNYKVVCTIGYRDGKGVNEYPKFIDEILGKLKNLRSNILHN